jgi:hypothetical protein
MDEPAKLLSLQLLTGERHVDAACWFLDGSDVRRIRRWNRYRHHGAKAEDAVEFARLAAKRMAFYQKAGRVVNSIEQAQSTIRKHPNAELAFLLGIGNAEKSSPLYGVTLFRRTWKQSLVVDFLSTHPRCFLRSPSIRGVGASLLQAISFVAEALSIVRIWGETTNTSAGFYQTQFRLSEPSDLFLVPHSKYHAFLQRTTLKRKPSSLP